MKYRIDDFMLLILPDVPAPSDQALEITTIVNNLNPYTQYKFRAVGVNVLGEGRPSKPSCKFCTLYFCPFISLLLIIVRSIDRL